MKQSKPTPSDCIKGVAGTVKPIRKPEDEQPATESPASTTNIAPQTPTEDLVAGEESASSQRKRPFIEENAASEPVSAGRSSTQSPPPMCSICKVLVLDCDGYIPCQACGLGRRERWCTYPPPAMPVMPLPTVRIIGPTPNTSPVLGGYGRSYARGDYDYWAII